MNTQQLEFVLTAIDRASPVFRTVENSLHSLARASGAVLGAFKNLLTGALDLARSLAGALVSALEQVAGVAARVAGILGGALVAGMIAVGKAGVDMNVTVERATLSLTRITGSAEGAAKLLGQLRQESLTSALTLKEMIPIGQQLAAVYGPQGIGKVIPTLRAFGDTAAVLGADKEAQARALLQFRQLIGSEKPRQDDVRRIGEDLPGLDVRGILKKAFGSSDTEALQDAGVTGRQVGEALVKGMQDAFGGSQNALSNTLPLILSNFEDAWNNLTAAIVSRFTPALTAALGKVLAVVQGLAGNERLISALAVPFDLLAAGITAAADALPAFVTWLESVLTRENVISLLANVAGAIKTIWDNVTGFVDAVTGGGGWGALWDTFQAAAATAIDFVLRIWSGFVAGVEYLAQNGPAIWGVIQQGIDGIRGAVETLVGAATVLVGILAVDKLAGIIGGILGIAGAVANLVGGVKTLTGPGGGGGLGPGAPAAILPTAAAIAIPHALGAPLPGAGIMKGVTNLFPGLKTLLNPPSATATPGSASGNPMGGIPAAIGGAVPPTIEALRKLGQGVIGGGGNLLGQGFNALPPALQSLLGGTAAAMQRGYQTGGLGALMGQQQGNTSLARKSIEGLLGPSGGPTDNSIPRTMLYGQGGGQGAGEDAPALPDKKQLRKIEAAREAYFKMMTAQAKAAGALLGSDEESQAERLWLELQQMIPALNEKQDSLEGRMRDLAERAKTDAGAEKDLYDAKAEWLQAEEQKADLRTRYQDAEQRATDKAARDADTASKKQRTVLSKQIDLAVATVENNPLLSNKGRGQAMADVLAKKFAFLSTPQAGESEEESLDRQIRAQDTRGGIFKALGLGMKSVGLLGGGSLDIGNRGRIGQINAYLDSIAKQAGLTPPSDPGGEATDGTGTPMLGSGEPVNARYLARKSEEDYWTAQHGAWAKGKGGSDVNVNIKVDSPPLGSMMQDPSFAAALQAFLMQWAYQQSQAANPGVSY